LQSGGNSEGDEEQRARRGLVPITRRAYGKFR
jgi:hypothetical protein